MRGQGVVTTMDNLGHHQPSPRGGVAYPKFLLPERGA